MATTWGQAKEALRRAGLRRFWRAPPPPSNLRLRAADRAAIHADVEYAQNCGRSYLEKMRSCGLSVEGLDVLEIGPGPNFGAMAYLAACGATVTVADRWLAPWMSAYHRPFYAALAAAIADEAPYPDRIAALAAADSYAGGPIALAPVSAEALGQALPAAFDAILSNAVLEHVYDLGAAAVGLCAATKPGGWGFHQVDYRDHRDFARPLEHLLFSAEMWAKTSARVHWEYGSQRRSRDYLAALVAGGFLIDAYSSSSHADPAYVEDLRERLRRAGRVFADDPTLDDLGGHFTLRRPPGAGSLSCAG